MSRVRATRLAQLLVVLVVVALAAISNATSSHRTSPLSARAVAEATHAQDPRPPAQGTAASGGADVEAPSRPAEAWTGAQSSGALLRTAAHTMALDSPIQGGLTVRQEQTLSARLRRAHRDVSVAARTQYWTPAMGRSAVARATSWLGMPYSWAAGSAGGPTAGRCDPGEGGDLDCHVIGFDCSGLMMYAWGQYASLPHLAATQRNAGAFHPTVKQLLPGDLVFFSGYLPGGTGHVAMYTGHGMIIEAPQSGSVITRATLADAMAEDGVYRGAVRPLTGRTPTLAVPAAKVSPTGGTVTLRGVHLADVDAVRVGGVTVRRFSQHSDSTIVFHVPAHHAGAVAVAVRTSWQAQSTSRILTYAQPRPPAPNASPTASASPPPAAATSSSAPPSTPSPTAPSTPSRSPQPSKASSTPRG